MITFEKSEQRHLGRADVVGLVIVDDGVISATYSRPGFASYFLVKITFSSDSEHFLDSVPTGIYETPLADAPIESIITDGDSFDAARHASLEDLEYAGVPSDSKLYVLDQDQLPARLQALTTADRDLILRKITAFCQD